jgi:cytochrome c oxidase subunit I+III
MDFWATMITFIEVSALVAAVELIVTIFKQRAPGMSLNRMPLFVWAILVMAFMIVFAMPPLMWQRHAGARPDGRHALLQPAGGGDPLLWQHLFWFFGHPEVYIIFVPALGMVSSDRHHVRAAADLRLHGARAVAGGHRHSSASACGCTTCSPPACRSSA